jgi:hypothetical protein
MQALLYCPTNSSHTEKPMKEVVEVNKMPSCKCPYCMFLLSTTLFSYLKIHSLNFSSLFQGVYHCGYHSDKTYGATSYFISHPDGNIMVDW